MGLESEEMETLCSQVVSEASPVPTASPQNGFLRSASLIFSQSKAFLPLGSFQSSTDG